jgi:hypothetical protein
MAGKSATQKAAEAFDTVVDFLGSFEPLDGPRQRGTVLDPLDEVLLASWVGALVDGGGESPCLRPWTRWSQA